MSQLQLRAFQNPLLSSHLQLPHSTSSIGIGNSVQRQTRFPLRAFGGISHVSVLGVAKKPVTSVSGFGFPFPLGNGVVGRSSLLFSSRAAAAAADNNNNKRKKTAKAKAVKDASSGESASKEVSNVASVESGLGEEAASGKQDSKVTVKKKKKKKPSSPSKKEAKASATNSAQEVAGEEVSRKSSSKGKKKNSRVSTLIIFNNINGAYCRRF